MATKEKIEKERSKNRKDITSTLTQATVHYLSHKMYSCHKELGVVSWGKLRMDILALNTKGNLIGCEIKSCLSDVRTDRKWKRYIPYTNKMYMVFPDYLLNNSKFKKNIKPQLREHGVGILALSSKSGYIYAASPAKARDIDPQVLQDTILRMAWRGGDSRRTIKRRRRLYI